MPEDNGIVNLPVSIPDWSTPLQDAPKSNTAIDDMNNAIFTPHKDTDFNQIATADLPKEGRFPKYFPGMDMEAATANSQTTLDRLGNASFNFISKTPAYLIQTAGFLGGAITAIGSGIVNLSDEALGKVLPDGTIKGDGKVFNDGNSISAMSDNFLVKLADVWKEKTEEIAPIYHEKGYDDASIWSKILPFGGHAGTWWLSDGVDRLALTAACLVPGFLEAKGLGLFGLSSEGEAVGRAQIAIKTMAENPENYGWLGRKLSAAAYKEATTGQVNLSGSIASNFKNAMKGAQYLEIASMNGVSQAALNAHESQVAIRKELYDQKNKGLNNFSAEEIEDKAASGANQAFMWNLIPAMLTSVYEIPQMFSSVKTAQEFLKKGLGVLKTEGAEAALDFVKKTTTRENVGSLLWTAAKTGALHGHEESLQVAMGRHIENAIAGHQVEGKVEYDNDNILMGSFKEMINNYSDPNGQNNLALGTIQGMLTSIFGHVYKSFKGEFKKQDEAKNKYIDLLQRAISENRQFNGLTDMIEKDAEGKPIVENEQPVWNQQKLTQYGASAADMVKKYAERVDAINKNDSTAIELLNHQSLAMLAKDFFQDSHGEEYLKDVLKYNAKVINDAIPNKNNDFINGTEYSPNTIVQNHEAVIEELKKTWKTIDQRHAGFLNIPVNKEEEPLFNQFSNALKDAQYSEASRQLFYKNKLQSNNTEALGLTKNLSAIPNTETGKIDSEKTEADKRHNEIVDENEKLSKYLQESYTDYKQLIDKQEANKNWSKWKQGFEEVKQKIKDIKNENKIIEDNKDKVITLKTKDGEEDLVAGTEYMLGKVTELDKDGNEVYRFPKLIILKENEDGTIKIKTSSGIIKDVSKEVLEDYKLGKASDVEKNKAANYFYNHINDLYTYNFGKNFGGEKEGRLRYDSKNNILNFEYTDANGNIKHKQVFNSSLVAQEGFTKARLNIIKTLKPETEEQKTAREDFTDPEEIKKTNTELDKKLTERRRIIKEVSDDTKKSIDELDKKIISKKEELKDIKSKLEELVNTDAAQKNRNIKGRENKYLNISFNKIFRITMKGLTHLSSMKENIEKEIEKLTNQKEELEFNYSYFQDFSTNLTELPEKLTELLEELNSQIDGLGGLAKSTGKQITELSNLSKSIKDSIKELTSFLKHVIEKFDKDYPEYLRNSIERILADESSYFNESDSIKTYLADIILAEDVKKEISINEEKIEEINKNLQSLYDNINNIDKEIRAKKAILKTFEDAIGKGLKEKEDKKRLQQSEVYKKSLDKQQKDNNNNSGIVTIDTPGTIPIKDSPQPDLLAFLSKDSDFYFLNDKNPIEEDTKNKPYQKRKLQFLSYLGKVFNTVGKNYKVLAITEKNEETYGLKGLINYIKSENENDDKGNPIIKLYVKKEGKQLSIIDQTGKPIAELAKDANLLEQVKENGVFGIFHEGIKGKYKYGPKKGQKNYSGDYTDEDVKKINEQFTQWRDKISKTDTSEIYDIDSVSRGMPIRDSKNKPVIKTGLVTENDFSKPNLIVVPSEQNPIITKNGENLQLQEGQPVLKIGNVVEILNNRTFSKEEAKSLFEVLREYVKQTQEGNFDEASKLSLYIRGILYFSAPKEGKEVSVKQVYYADGNMFFGREYLFPFTEESIKNSEKEITEWLEKTYNNTNSHYLTSPDYQGQKFISYDKDLKAIEHDNYQSFLLTGDNPFLQTTIREKDEFTNRPNVVSAYTTLNNNTEFKIQETPKKEEKVPIPEQVKEAVKTTEPIDESTTVDIPPDILQDIQKYFTNPNNLMSFAQSNKIDLSAFQTGDIKQIQAVQKKMLETYYDQHYKTTISSEKQEESEFEKAKKAAKPRDKGTKYKLADVLKNYNKENIEKVLKYIKEKTPFSPEILSEILKTPEGFYAWGSYKDMVIKLYNGATEGTGYHEIFEGVFHEFLSVKDKEVIFKEFKQRQGTFEHFNGKDYETIEYKNASEYQMKEAIADEFGEYILNGKIPEKIGKNAVLKFFYKILSFIRSIFDGSVKDIEQLFKNIDVGKYKSPANRNITDRTAEHFKLSDLSYLQQYEMIKGASIELIQSIVGDGNSLVEFENSELKVNQYFDNVYEEFNQLYENDILLNESIPENLQKAYYNLWQSTKADWDLVKEKIKENLRTFSIVEKLQGNNEIEYNKEYIGDKAYWQTDAKNSASRIVKLLFATIPESIFTGESISGRPEVESKLSTATMLQTQINYSKNFNNLLSQLVGVNSMEEKTELLKELGLKNPNFERLYQRLIKPSDNTLNDWKLKIQFYSAMSKQNPTAYIQYNTEDGFSNTGTANIESSKKIAVQSWLDNMKQLAMSKVGVFSVKNDIFTINTAKLDFTVKTVKDRINFINQLGVNFTIENYNSLSKKLKESFDKGVNGLAPQLRIKSEWNIDNTSGWDSSKNLSQIAEAVLIARSEIDSTFYGLDGDRRTQFVSSNAFSKNINDINNSLTKEELFQKMPQLRQITDSIYLNKILYDADGHQIRSLFDLGYIMGTLDSDGKAISGESLTPHQRLIQEINQNLSGRYYTLSPGDSVTQWLNSMWNVISLDSVKNNTYDISDTIKTYYNTEKSRYEELKEILSEEDLAKIAGIFKEMSKDYTLSDEEIIDSFNKFIENSVKKQIDFLTKFNVITQTEDGFVIKNIDSEFKNKNFKEFLSEKDVYNIIKFRTLNYAINNTELQKLFFGDILEYTDPIKRYKLFLSPREVSIHGEEDFNEYLNAETNKAGNIELKDSLLGKTTHSDFITTATMADVIIHNEELSKLNPAYKKTNSTDAQGYSTLPQFRLRRLKEGKWDNIKDEEQYQYSQAFDRQLMLEDKILNDKNYPKNLQEQDKKLIKKSNPNSAFFYVEKPIVSGFVQQEGKYNPLIDKLSIVSFSYAAIRNTNFRDHYVKMLKQDIGYIVQQSGRKVGARGLNTFYDKDGNINKEEFKSLIQVPFSAFGTQTDTSSKKENQIRGSQITTLIIVNLYNAGKPTSDIAYTLAQHNIALLNEQTKLGVTKLLNKFGAEDTGNGFKINDKTKIVDLLKDELLRREMPENIKNLLKVDSNNQLVTAFEAMPNYIQIKNILYSYVDKYITSPKVSGSPAPQVSGAMMEKYGVKRTTINGKDVYVSAGLHMYTKEEPWIGVLMPFYATQQLRKAGLVFNSPEELMEIIKKSPDVDRILKGIGFRIPTQELNSMENFRIEGFLPEHMGDTIVVPEEITTKVGSDFDIDKLNRYLQNLYVDAKGEVRIIPYFGIGEEAKKQLKAHFEEDAIDTFEKFYAQSIENEYFDNISKILELPENYERLITPNTDEDPKGVRELLVELAPNEFSSGENKSILDPMYMLKSRQDNLSSKALVGICAVAQTNTAKRQLSDIHIDLTNSSNLPKNENTFLGDGKVYFAHNKNENEQISLSQIKDQEDKYITDNNSQYLNGSVDAVKNNYLAQINFNQRTASTILYMISIGMPSSKETPIVGMLSNQPIVRDLIDQLNIDSKNSRTILDVNVITKIKKEYNVSQEHIKEAKDYFEKNINKHKVIVDTLKAIIKKYYAGIELTKKEKGQQLFILNEFLKYNVMAQNVFRFTQGTNWDTSIFNDNNSIFFKNYQYSEANDTIISSPDKLLESTFVGEQKRAIEQSTNTLKDVLVTEEPIIKSYLTKILERIAPKYLSLDDKNILAKKAEESLLNFMIQQSLGLQNELQKYLVNPKTALVNELKTVKDKLLSLDTNQIGGNVILNNLIPYIKGKSILNTKNIKLAIQPKDVFSKNLYSDAFEELIRNPNTMDLAKSLIKLSFMQNGVSNSPISLKDMIPASYYANYVNEALKNKENKEMLQDFIESGAFYRNNWNNDKIVKDVSNYGRELKSFSTQKIMSEINSYFKGKPRPSILGVLSSMVNISDPYVKHTTEEMGENEDGSSDIITQTKLYKRVESLNNEPLTYIEYVNGQAYPKTLYIQVNAWGDGFKAIEHYNDGRQSVFNNDIVKTKEIDSYDLYNFLEGTIKEKIDGKPEYHNIKLIDEFITWNLGGYEGLPQTKERQDAINRTLINEPDTKIVSPENENPTDKISPGESFNEFASRILNKVKELINEKNSVVLTHNSAFGLIKLWNEQGRPETLSKEFRELYTKQDSDTSAYFNIKRGKNLEIKNIYSNLGNKTQSKNVKIKSWGELKDATHAITPQGIIATRIKNSNAHFGNPFSHDPAGKAQGLIETKTIKEAVEKYTNWVINSEEPRAQWIKERLKSGELKGKPILYYKELGEPSHATALDYLINQYNWNDTNKENIIVARHGQTSDNKSSADPIGKFRRDSAELTKEGKKEALELGKKLSEIPISQIYSSSLPRAIETANIIMSKQNNSINSSKEETNIELTKNGLDKSKVEELSKIPDWYSYKNIETVTPTSEAMKRYQKETNSDVTKYEDEFFKNNPEFGDKFIEQYLKDPIADSTTISEYAKKLLTSPTSLYENIDNKIGDIFTIDNQILRLLDVKESEEYNEKIATFETKSGQKLVLNVNKLDEKLSVNKETRRPYYNEFTNEGKSISNLNISENEWNNLTSKEQEAIKNCN